jgi:hypothetical protein
MTKPPGSTNHTMFLPERREPRSICRVVRVGRVEWSGVEWIGVDWSGVVWSGVEWGGVGWSGVGQLL